MVFGAVRTFALESFILRTPDVASVPIIPPPPPRPRKKRPNFVFLIAQLRHHSQTGRTLPSITLSRSVRTSTLGSVRPFLFGLGDSFPMLGFFTLAGRISASSWWSN